MVTTRHKYITKYNKLIMAETILVTGATGTLGSEVVKQLSSKAEQDVTVKAVARSATCYWLNIWFWMVYM